jgi:zinc protease
MAYSVQSVIRPRKKTGVFLAFAQTKTENTREVISILNENIERISKEPVSKEELEWAKESLTNSFVFKFDNTMELIGNILELEYTGLPKNYYEKYTDNLKKITTDNILKESGMIFADGLVKVVVGNPSLKDDLKKFGEVVDLN